MAADFEPVASLSIHTRSAVRPGSDQRSVFADRWFGVLWPLAVLLHLAGNPAHLLALNHIGVMQLAVVAAAVGLLVAPSGPAAVGLAGTYLVVLWLKLPVVGNHEIVLGLTALVVLVAVMAAERIDHPDRNGDWVGAAAPTLRVMLVVAYGFMALAKWNRGFLDVVHSCAVLFGDEMLGGFGLGPGAHRPIAWLVIAASIAIETAVPILLVVRRTRLIGVPLAIGFHGFLSLDPASHIWDFSSALLPLFLLFAGAQVRARLDGFADRLHAVGRTTALGGAGLLVATQAVVLLAWIRFGTPPWPVAYPLWLAVLALVALVLFQHRVEPTVALAGEASLELGRTARVALLAVVTLAALNGVAPYLELRSAAAFNMYSNLAVVDGTTNHLLVPALRSTPEAPTFVRILDADGDANLDHYHRNDLLLPAATLERHLAANPGLAPVVQRGDGPETVAAASTADGSGLLGTVVHKLGFRRAVDGAGTHRCGRAWGPLG